MHSVRYGARHIQTAVRTLPTLLLMIDVRVLTIVVLWDVTRTNRCDDAPSPGDFFLFSPPPGDFSPYYFWYRIVICLFIYKIRRCNSFPPLVLVDPTVILLLLYYHINTTVVVLMVERWDWNET